MKAFENYSTSVRSTGKEILREYFLPLLIEFVLLFVSVQTFMYCVPLGPMVQEPVMFARQMTQPTAGRLAFGALSLALWLAFSHLAARTRRGRIQASMITYIALGVLAFGIMES